LDGVNFDMRVAGSVDKVTGAGSGGLYLFKNGITLAGNPLSKVRLNLPVLKKFA
jgi:hypothetical protein